MLALELSHIRKVFASTGEPRVGLRDLSLRVTSGELLTIIGGNGSGKSTLLRTIAGFLTPDAGAIRVLSEDVTNEPPHKRSRFIALVDQDPSRSSAADLSVAETIGLAARRSFARNFVPLLRGPDARMLRRDLATYNERLSDLWTSIVGELSGGERQMLAMATAWIRGCDVFLLDEHTAALDARNSQQVWDVTIDLQREQLKTVIVVTHDIERALNLPGRLIVMMDGEIAIDASGPARNAVSRKRVLDLYVGSRRGVDE